jgi:hypothetical protein
MYISFENLPKNARIWVYQSDKVLTDALQADIAPILENFINQWEAHGAPLLGSYLFKYQRFIIIAIDEAANAPSGCAIDKSVAVLKAIEQKYQINLFDRTQIAFYDNDLLILPLSGIKTAVKEGVIRPDMHVFNNNISTISALENEWLVPVTSTWTAKYFTLVNK